MKQLFVAALAAATLSSCVIDDDDDFESEFRGPGELIVDWSIAGGQDPDLCFELGASSISIVVQTSTGAFVGDFRQACEEFATSIVLDPDFYIADAVLLDPADQERTTAVQIDRFTIFGDDRLTIPIDFPVNSFF